MLRRLTCKSSESSLEITSIEVLDISGFDILVLVQSEIIFIPVWIVYDEVLVSDCHTFLLSEVAEENPNKESVK